MDDSYSITEMIDAIQDYLREQGYEPRPIYDPELEPARVPIYAIKEGESDLFVDVITEKNIKASDYFKDNTQKVEMLNVSSAQFYRHYFPDTYAYWAIPEYADNNSITSNEFIEKCKKDYIGILKVKRKQKKFSVEKITDSPVQTLMQERLANLESMIEKKWKKKINGKQKNDLQKVLTRYSHEDQFYLVLYPAPLYRRTEISSRDDKFSISRALINKMGELENISYKDLLIDFSESYYRKEDTDYNIALNFTEKLWKRYDLTFPTLHKDYEPILKLNPEYRDHFLHSFQVFLYGAYVIDKMYSRINKINVGSDIGHTIEDAWVLAATYHDYNYMVEDFDNWTQIFFMKALYLDKEDKPASLNLGEPYVKRGYMVNTKKLLNYFCIKSMDNTTLDFLYDRILGKKNHGLISSLSLLKYLEGNSGKLNSEVIDKACRAIAMHDKKIWYFLSGIAQDSASDSIGNAFKEKKIIKEVSFEADPITFLLILSDSLQEDGREKEDSIMRTDLRKLYTKKNEIYSEIRFHTEGSNRIGSSVKAMDKEQIKKIFKNKDEELEKVCDFLSGSNRFHITITRDIGEVKNKTNTFTI